MQPAIIELDDNYEPQPNHVLCQFLLSDDVDDDVLANEEELSAMLSDSAVVDDDDDDMKSVILDTTPVLRTQSEINQDNRKFLLQYIAENNVCKGYKWTGDRVSHLEAAAVNKNVGGYSTQQMIDQIKLLLQSP